MSVDPYVVELAQAYRDEHERFVSRWVLERQARSAEREAEEPRSRGRLRLRPGNPEFRHR